MQLRTPLSRTRSQDDHPVSTVETPRTSEPNNFQKRIPLLSTFYKKSLIQPFGSLPCSTENTFSDSDRRFLSTAVSSKRFKFVINTQAGRVDSPETARPESKVTQAQKKLGIVSTENNPQYKRQKGLFKPASLNLKDKISMNHFLFDSESTALSPLLRPSPPNPTYQQPTLHKPALSSIDVKQFEDRIDTSQPTNIRNTCIEISTTSTPKETSVGGGGFFKTSISTRDTKNAIQVLNEIKQSGAFRLNRPVTSNVSPRRETNDDVYDDMISSKFETSKVQKVFKTKKGILTTHKQSLNKQQNVSKEILQRKMEIHDAIEKNRGKIMICALMDSNANMKYCFLPRQASKSITPRTTRGMREDVEFKIALHEIQRKLHLDNSFKFAHLLDGLPIFAFYQVPAYEKVVVISQSSRLGDVTKIANHEIVRRFCSYFEKKNESIYDVIAGFDTKERINQCRKEILHIVDNTHQLTADQLRNLVSLSNEGTLSESTKAIQGAFLSGKVGSVLLEGEKASTYVDRSYLKSWTSKKNSYLETLLAPKYITPLTRKNSLEIGIYETEVEKYIKSTRPLQEHKKLATYKHIIREYDDSLKKVNRKSSQDDDEQGLDQEYIDQVQEDARRLSAKALRIDQNLGHLLKTNDHDLKKAINLGDSGQFNKLPLTSESTMKTPVHKEAELLNLSKKRLYDKQDKQLDSTITEKKVEKKFTEENIKALDTKKNCIKKLQTVNRELFLRNIPKMVQEKKLSRPELHSIYVLYKALCEVTSQRHKEYNINDGIDFETFRSGIYNVAMQSEELSARLFFAIDTNFSGFLDWEEFLEAMVTLRAKTLHDKIDLFIKLADEDGNGNLSKDEIFNLTKICLGKFIKDDDGSAGFLDELCHYFTKLIFISLDYKINEEIPLEAIKEAIVSGNPNSDLLAMFCGADI